MKTPLLSIVIPVYNVEQYLVRCINSILRQSYKDFEIILIDDGSTDNSGKICDQYVNIDNRIKVIHQTNCGVSSARNAGLSFCKGMYITFVDADDWVENIYEQAITLLCDTKADMIVYGFYDVKQDTILSRSKCPVWKTKSTKEYDVLIETTKCLNILGTSGVLWNKIIKRTVLQDIQFDITIRYGEDLLYLTEIILKIKKAIVLHKYGYNYFISRNDSAVSAKLNSSYLDFLNATSQVFDIVKNYAPVIAVERIRIAAIIMCKKINGAEIEMYSSQIEYCKTLLRKVKFKYFLSYIISSSINIKCKFSILLILFNLKLAIVIFKSK